MTNLSLQDVKKHFKSADDAALPVKTGESLLHLECEKAVPTIAVIKYLLQTVDVNKVDKSGWTGKAPQGGGRKS